MRCASESRSSWSPCCVGRVISRKKGELNQFWSHPRSSFSLGKEPGHRQRLRNTLLGLHFRETLVEVWALPFASTDTFISVAGRYLVSAIRGFDGGWVSSWRRFSSGEFLILATGWMDICLLQKKMNWGDRLSTQHRATERNYHAMPG